MHIWVHHPCLVNCCHFAFKGAICCMLVLTCACRNGSQSGGHRPQLRSSDNSVDPPGCANRPAGVTGVPSPQCNQLAMRHARVGNHWAAIAASPRFQQHSCVSWVATIAVVARADQHPWLGLNLHCCSTLSCSLLISRAIGTTPSLFSSLLGVKRLSLGVVGAALSTSTSCFTFEHSEIQQTTPC